MRCQVDKVVTVVCLASVQAHFTRSVVPQISLQCLRIMHAAAGNCNSLVSLCILAELQ
jgi:hypothetical protein